MCPIENVVLKVHANNEQTKSYNKPRVYYSYLGSSPSHDAFDLKEVVIRVYRLCSFDPHSRSLLSGQPIARAVIWKGVVIRVGRRMRIRAQNISLQRLSPK